MVRLSKAIAALATFITVVVAGPKTPKVPFDGQYIQPTVNNSAVEWWWVQALGEPTGNNPPPTFQLLFYQGYPVKFGPRDPSLPQEYMLISGFFPNGTEFNLNIPAEFGTAVATGHGEEVKGTWGSVATFHASSDLKEFNVNLTAEKYGLTGTMKLKADGKYHYPCNDDPSNPYFSSAVKGLSNLTTAEDILFNKLGWAVTIPGGQAELDVMINGTQLKYGGYAYHDANWSPAPLNEVIKTWYFGSAEAGPYDLSYVVAETIDGRVLNTGYLSKNGNVLQNQCSINGTKTMDVSYVKPYGAVQQGGSLVPEGYVIEYVLKNGDQYAFNLSHRAVSPNRPSYHRWVGTVEGGKKSRSGTEMHKGTTMFEWLNPGLTTYNPPA